MGTHIEKVPNIHSEETIFRMMQARNVLTPFWRPPKMPKNRLSRKGVWAGCLDVIRVAALGVPLGREHIQY